MTGAMVGAAWGARTGFPNATGAPITAGAAMVVPHGEPRWSQFRKPPEWQPALAAVRTAKANRIGIFLIFKNSTSGAPG
jgi:hypothetical protein